MLTIQQFLDRAYDTLVRSSGQRSAKKRRVSRQRAELTNRALAVAKPEDRDIARAYPEQFLKVGPERLRRDLAQLETRRQSSVDDVRRTAAELRQSIAANAELIAASAAAPVSRAERRAILAEDERLARELGLYELPEPNAHRNVPAPGQTAKPVPSFVKRLPSGKVHGSGAAGRALLAQLDRLRHAHDAGGLTLTRLATAWRDVLKRALT